MREHLKTNNWGVENAPIHIKLTSEDSLIVIKVIIFFKKNDYKNRFENI